jgi:hypothetical protein
MKQRDILLGLSLMAGCSAFAASSPFQGSPAAEGTFYLYQVETGRWLQSNMKFFDTWTTLAQLDEVGFDVQLKKIDGFEGFQLFCNYTANGELNGSDQDRFYLDQADRDLTDWVFEPVTVDGVPNAYKIMVKAKPDANDRSKIAEDVYIGAADGELSDHPTEYTWQLVTREERLEKMLADVKNGPVDATWLIPWNDLGRNDMRDRLWTKNVANDFGGAHGLGGPNGYPVQEAWHRVSLDWSYTIDDLPSGTYGFAVQAYYRDTEIESPELRDRYLAGEENLRASYFAGASTGTVKSIFADAKEQPEDGFTYKVYTEETPEGEFDPNDVKGVWVPNSTGDAGRAMFNGNYINDFISAPVSDGKLTIGVKKTENGEDAYRDWLIIKRFYLRYESTELMQEDLSALKSELTELIAKAEALPTVPSLVKAIATAKEQLESASTSTSLLEAITELRNVVDAVSGSADNIRYYNETKAINDRNGVAYDRAAEIFETASSKDNFRDALMWMRYARRRAAAVKQPNVFEGAQPDNGNFYLYNVGQQQFLCGGSDWGAHAALGMPGLELTIEDFDADNMTFRLNTHLENGDGKHYMNDRGYMDTAGSTFRFTPVDGQVNVFTITQADYPDAIVIYDPTCGTDQNNNDETTVSCESRSGKADDPNAHWMLITRAERDALLEKATLDNPVEATHFIKNPNFNQREDTSVWDWSNINVGSAGSNHPDFIAESWNQETCNLNQMVEGLPAGIYAFRAQGYYRNGSHVAQPDLSFEFNDVVFYANDDEMVLPNITSESFNAPGEGDNATAEDGTVYNYPNSIDQAPAFFKSGLYPMYVVTEVGDGDQVALGVEKKSQAAAEDWVVVDNFRAVYYGKDTTKEAVQEKIASGVISVIDSETVKGDNRIFNIQGFEVKDATAPGIYIRNGKKFVVK